MSERAERFRIGEPGDAPAWWHLVHACKHIFGKHSLERYLWERPCNDSAAVSLWAQPQVLGASAAVR
jgi:hypothetical protein